VSFNRTPLALEDVRVILDRALAARVGVRVPFATKGEAVYWRGRANYLRRQDRKDNAAIYRPDHPLHKQSAYDGLRLFLIDERIIVIKKVSATVPDIEELEE